MKNLRHVMTHVLPVTALIASITGCSVMAPKYTRPVAPVPATLPAGTAVVQAAQKPVADIPWQEFIADQRLQKVVGQALANNRDLQVAALNIERSEALYQIQRNDLLPKLDATAGASYQRIPATLSGVGHGVTTEQYNIGLGVLSYELDLFGRVRSLKGQALEQFLATEHAQRSVQIGLISQVATAWLTLAADRERLRLAKDTLANQQQAFNLTSRRYEAGVSSALDVNQARTILESARIDIARYTTQLAQDENALNQLVGSPVAADLLPVSVSDALAALKEITPGLASEALLGRPDILQAESLLKGANANIGAARAAFFPRITLVSTIGFGSDELSSLFRGGAIAWRFAPQITLPLFDGGSNKANEKVSEVDRKIAVAQYEKAIQTAFREVSDALAQRGTIDEQLAAQQAFTDATAASYRLSLARYEKGVDSFLAVLDSQRSLYGAEQNMVTTRLIRLTNLVTLYKSLGGGGKP